ncbi:MAG: GNAT family N-acetyltransferase [Armatimonadota bacterium]
MLNGLFGGVASSRKAAASRQDPFAETLVLSGEHLVLRPLHVSDTGAMFTYASDPEVTRFLPWEPATEVENVRPFLEDQVARRERRESLGLAILLRETNEMIGSTDLMDLKRARGEAELGYLLARPYWGRGLMTEAARLTLEHGFDRLRLNRIRAYADAANQGSRRVLEKVGMRVVGTEIRTVHQEDRPYMQYEIRRTDWLAQQK